MSEGDDGAPKRPAGPKMPVAAPRPKPPVPRAAAAAAAANPFLTRESTRDIDVGWLAPEDAAEVSIPAPAVAETPREATPETPREATPEAPREAPRMPIQAASAERAPPTTAAHHAPEAEPHPVDDAGAAQPSEPPPFAKKSRAKSIAFLLLGALVLAGGGLVVQSRIRAASSKVERPQPSASLEAPIEPAAPVAVPPPPPTHTPDPPPSASAEKKAAAAGANAGAAAGAPTSVSADPAKQGILDTTPLPPGRKIIVDGRLFGTSPRKVAVRCGVHRVQIGDLPPESIEFPCGGEVTFTD